MMLFSTIIMCLLALIVLLGGLFLLGYAKKEGWGKFSKMASYLSICFSTIVFLIGIIGIFACPSKCGDGHCSGGVKEEKCIVIKKDCKEGSSCEAAEMTCHGKMECESEMEHCMEVEKCPKGEGCNTPEECATKMSEMKNCSAECMKKCEKKGGVCDDACKKKCEEKK